MATGLLMDTNAMAHDHWWPIMSGEAPVPEVRPSWERELRVEGEVYRQEGAAGDGGRPRFRGKTIPGRTVSWAAGEGSCTSTTAGRGRTSVFSSTAR